MAYVMTVTIVMNGSEARNCKRKDERRLNALEVRSPRRVRVKSCTTVLRMEDIQK